MQESVAIVGNGPVPDGVAEMIDASGVVIRFNEPLQPVERIGARTDILFLMNSGKTMQHRLSDPAFVQSQAFRNARRVVLPYHPSIVAKYHPRPNILSRLKGRKADWTTETLAMLEQAGKEAVVLPAAFYEESCGELGIPAERRNAVFPSSGFLGIRYALTNFMPPQWKIGICGFGWDGWKRHPWADERRIVASLIECGEISVIDGRRQG
jgi:hypothetical protein